MTNNDILKRLRFALNISDTSLVEMVDLGGNKISASDLILYFKNEDEEEYKNCSNSVLTSFLDGLILKKRGSRSSDVPKGKPSPRNNSVMKKLRIALELKEPNMIEIFNKVDFRISKSEITALFRRSDAQKFYSGANQNLS